MLDNGADCGTCVELVERADLGGILVGDVLHAQRACELCSKARIILAVAKNSISRTPGAGNDAEHTLDVALPVDGMVPFIGRGDIQSTTRIADVRADEVAERTVSAEETPKPRWGAAGRVVVAG